jgi:predicted RNase H-like nuclease (RuvC/YqgF family)
MGNTVVKDKKDVGVQTDYEKAEIKQLKSTLTQRNNQIKTLKKQISELKATINGQSRWHDEDMQRNLRIEDEVRNGMKRRMEDLYVYSCQENKRFRY